MATEKGKCAVCAGSNDEPEVDACAGAGSGCACWWDPADLSCGCCDHAEDCCQAGYDGAPDELKATCVRCGSSVSNKIDQGASDLSEITPLTSAYVAVFVCITALFIMCLC